MFTVTPVGRAVARSGLLPITANELLEFFSSASQELLSLAKACANSQGVECDDFSFVILHAVFSCSEFAGADLGSHRYLPYQLLKPPLAGPQQRVRHLLFSPSQYDAVNAAILSHRWITGVPIRDIERIFSIRSGELTAMFANAGNIIRSISDVLYALTTPQEADMLSPAIQGSDLHSVKGLIGSIRRIAMRLDSGLPEDALWLASLKRGNNDVASGSLLNRNQIIGLRDNGFSSPDQILDPGRFSSLTASLGANQASARSLAQLLQQAVRSWKKQERDRLLLSQIKRLGEMHKPLLLQLYSATGLEFEEAINNLFVLAGFNIVARDDPKVNAFPDFVISSIPTKTCAIECKSKLSVDATVTFNDATDVIRKASVNGHASSFKITVCQPYLSPDIPRKLTACDELCVVNTEDLAEGVVRLLLGRLTIDDFGNWLQRPGQALREMLPSGGTVIAIA